MRVFVAIGAQVEGDAYVLRLPIGAVGMALGALHLRVQPGQRIAGLAVIELGRVDLLPVDEVMAGLAVRTKSTLVEILVAGNASGRQAEIRAVQVFLFDRGPFLRGDVRGIMALIAFQTGVLAFKNVSSFLVVEGLGIPLDKGKVFAVVVGMAAGAFLTGALRDVIGCVKSSMGRQAAGDFRVAFQAFERRLAAEFVTDGAVGGSVQ